MCTTVKSICRTPKANRTLSVNYTSIKKKKRHTETETEGLGKDNPSKQDENLIYRKRTHSGKLESSFQSTTQGSGSNML